MKFLLPRQLKITDFTDKKEQLLDRVDLAAEQQSNGEFVLSGANNVKRPKK